MEEEAVVKTVDDEEEVRDPFVDENNPTVITLKEITAAAARLKGGVVYTPCNRTRISDLYGIELYVKKEFRQFTGNFKERGARNALLMLDEKYRKKGVVSASSGNHAQAISYHGLLLNIPVTVVVPVSCPIGKIKKCKKYKANVIVEGKDVEDSHKVALLIAKRNDLTFISSYDHPHVIAGQGTVGLEILEQVPNVAAVAFPCGGCGLIGGSGKALKSLKPSVKVIGIESEKCPGFTMSVKAGKVKLVEAEATLADGLSVPLIGSNAFANARTVVDKTAVVKEESIALSMLRLIEIEKCVVEGAAATTLAAVLEGQLKEFKGKQVALVATGGNIDTTVLGRCLERGLAADGRLIKATVTVSDRPGGIAELVRLMASIGVNVKDIFQERAWVTYDVFSVNVMCMCETRDIQHSKELRELLKKNYKRVTLEFIEECFDKSKC